MASSNRNGHGKRYDYEEAIDLLISHCPQDFGSKKEILEFIGFSTTSAMAFASLRRMAANRDLRIHYSRREQSWKIRFDQNKESAGSVEHSVEQMEGWLKNLKGDTVALIQSTSDPDSLVARLIEKDINPMVVIWTAEAVGSPLPLEARGLLVGSIQRLLPEMTREMREQIGSSMMRMEETIELIGSGS